MRQWMLRITAYAERLIDELDGLDWPEGIKALQRNWIGRSEGALVKFQVSGLDAEIEVFTTRPDTLFGATYMVLSPEHPLVAKIARTRRARQSGSLFGKSHSKIDLERTDLAKEKTGVFTGAFAINPVNSERIPDLDCGLRSDGLRDRRDHGGAGSRRKRFRVREEVRA